MTLQFGEQEKRRRQGRGRRRSEGAASTPEETSTRLGQCDFYHFTEGKEGEGEVSCFVVPVLQVNYTFRIY